MKKKADLLNLFITISLLSVILSFFTFVLGDNTFSDVTAVGNFNKLFNDFVFHLYYAKDLSTIYTKSIHVCFPPLIYIFYHFLNLMLPKEIDYNPMFNLCAIYLVVGFLIFAYAVKTFLKSTNDKKAFLTIILISLSSCFTFGIIQCANIAFLVLILLLFALRFKESDSKFKQELAMIFIAVAAAIKIYPAVFGLLYIAERKYKQAARLVVYGILFFFVPFVFTGGVDGFSTFLDNQIQVQKTWGELSPNGIYTNLVEWGFGDRISKAAVYACGALAFVLFFAIKDNWKKMFLLSFIIVMCPLWSGAYTPAFFVIPLLCLINEAKCTKSKFNLAYVALFSVMFTSSCFTFRFSSLKIFVTAFAILLMILIEEAAKLKKRKNTLTTSKNML